MVLRSMHFACVPRLNRYTASHHTIKFPDGAVCAKPRSRPRHDFVVPDSRSTSFFLIAKVELLSVAVHVRGRGGSGGA